MDRAVNLEQFHVKQILSIECDFHNTPNYTTDQLDEICFYGFQMPKSNTAQTICSITLCNKAKIVL